MNTFPLENITLEEAVGLQFRVVDAATRHIDGYEALSLGDLGVLAGINKPARTLQVEHVFADVFQAQSALFVRGAGTGAIRWALTSVIPPGGALLVHSAPVYPTTQTTLETMGIKTITADFNNADAIKDVVKTPGIDAVLVQHTRQQIEDRYDFPGTVRLLKKLMPEVPVITDDNYAALKVREIGCQAGADISTFSCFKTLGPEGVGVLVGKSQYVDRVAALQYSGGSQVQGHEAMAALRGLIYAPVALAISAKVTDELAERLNKGELPGVRRAYIANAQSRVLLVEFDSDIAEAVMKVTPGLGAAAHPVGSESIYETAPMIYRVSGTFRKSDPSLEKRMIRINPMRSGPETVIRILREAIKRVMEEGR
jgi:cystathionine beta-lyase family protein involved in aluminum resistance